MNILILRVSSIGDIIHTLPAIFLLKRIYPQAKISWIVQQKAANLLEFQPFLENVWVLKNNFLVPKNWFHTLNIIKQIRKTRWNAILDFQGILKTSILAVFFKGIKYGFDFKNSRLWVTSFLTNRHTKPIYNNIIQKNLTLVCDMLIHKKDKNIKICPTINSLKKDFQLNIPIACKKEVDKWLEQNKIKNFIALAPNTTWPSKHWPLQNWKKFLELLIKNSCLSKNYSIVLIGKDFGDHAQKLSNIIKNKKLVVFTAKRWDLITTSYLISKGNLLIAPDTGLLHIADFLDKKTIGIFGPTSAKLHGPFLNYENIKNAIQIKCPHYYLKTHGTKRKNYEKTGLQSNCMYKLSPESLLKKILQILSG